MITPAAKLTPGAGRMAALAARAALAALSGLALGACSVATPPSLAAGQRPAERLAAVKMDPAMPGGEAGERFTSALTAALARHGVAVTADSQTVISIALSQRPAAIGVSQSPEETWLSPPRKHRLLDACQAQRIAVRVMARHENQARPAFSASGGFDFCTLDSADLDALAEQFAAAIAAV